MNKLSRIGGLLKKIYRSYSSDLLGALQQKGFTDLRPSFLEVLLFVCDSKGPTIKEIGVACGLKKQTMTSHLNELESRGYIARRPNERDKREQNIFLTEYGERFKFGLLESIREIEERYAELFGQVELERMEHLLGLFHSKILSRKGMIREQLPLEGIQADSAN